MFEVLKGRSSEVVGHEGQAFEDHAGVIGLWHQVRAGIGGEEVSVLVLVVAYVVAVRVRVRFRDRSGRGGLCRRSGGEGGV